MDVNGQFTIPSAFKTYLGYNFLFYQKEPRNSIAILTDKCRTQEHPGIRGILWDYSGTLTSNIGATLIVGLQWDYSGTIVLFGSTLKCWLNRYPLMGTKLFLISVTKRFIGRCWTILCSTASLEFLKHLTVTCSCRNSTADSTLW